MEVSGEPHALVALPPGKELRYPFNRFGGPRSRSGRFGESFFLLLAGVELRIVQPAA